MLGYTVRNKVGQLHTISVNCMILIVPFKVKEALKRVKTIKWWWAGHIPPRDNDRWPKAVLEWLSRETWKDLEEDSRSSRIVIYERGGCGEEKPWRTEEYSQKKKEPEQARKRRSTGRKRKELQKWRTLCNRNRQVAETIIIIYNFTIKYLFHVVCEHNVIERMCTRIGFTSNRTNTTF